MIGSRAWLGGIALGGVAAVGAALVSQHFYGMQPCPWCVLQRAIFAAIGLVALLGALLPFGLLRRGLGVVVLLLAASGVAAALWLHFVAASSASCDLTLADRIIGDLGLDARFPEVFMATASCADAKVDLLGLPYEVWALALFVLIGAAAVRLVLPSRVAGRR